ncbi:MAG: rane-bound lytic murein transglycosylase [Abditibacteriota bacterium]|nr:rane-bound lytic murein transglycosylase [Abditibacteriota bacterium]
MQETPTQHAPLAQPATFFRGTGCRVIVVGLLFSSTGIGSNCAPLQAQLHAQPAPGPAQASSKYFAAADNRLWRGVARAGERKAVLRAIDHSLRYLRTQRAAGTYARLGISGVSRARVRRSLIRFRQLWVASRSTAQLEAALRREFVLYRPASRVHFTGYFEPTYAASRQRSAVYRYPLFRMPPALARVRSHPTRLQLEGADGLQISPLLRGYEIAWLRDRLEAYLVQVEGSARLRLTDGRTLSIGYGGHTSHTYTSMGRELVKDGVMPFEQLTLPALIEYFGAAPQEMNRYLPRNRRFVFFRETRGGASSGSIGVPLTPEHSMATDAAALPPGALALAQIELANPVAARVFGSPTLTRWVLGQDAGGAIKGRARVDLFMGSGARAGRRAGVINSMGQLAYLLLK